VHERIGSDIGQSIPFVCQDWANTKAAYHQQQTRSGRQSQNIHGVRNLDAANAVSISLSVPPLMTIISSPRRGATSCALRTSSWNVTWLYRFFANHRVSEADILSGHFQSTRERAAAMDGPVLVLHDTTEFTYQRDRPELIGITKRNRPGGNATGVTIASSELGPKKT
jgi:hypothetical protein